MFSTSIFQPIIGRWIDNDKALKAGEGLTGDALELAAGQETLSTMILFPVILIIAFLVLFFWQKKSKTAN